MVGFLFGEVDLLRWVVSKKKVDVLNEEWIYFVEGVKSRGYLDVSVN